MSRVIRAGVWSTALRSGLRSIGFVRNVVLARILAPEDIGLFAIALVVLSVIERFSNTGLTAALVQRRESVDRYLNTAWTVQVLRGGTLAALLVLAAPGAASFFEEHAVAPLIRVLSLTVLLRSLKNPGIVQLRRDLDVRSQFLIRSGGASMDLVVSIGASLALRNAWGLMLGLIAGSLANLVLSYVMHPFRPRLALDLSQLKGLTSFGIWVFLNDVLFFLAYRGDNLLVGKILGSVALGAYILAYSISEVLTVEVSRVFSEVGFPAYSRIQDEFDRLRRALGVSVEVVTSVTFPAAAVLFLLAGPIVAVVLGARWSTVAIVLPPLAIAGAIRSWLAAPMAACTAVGKPSHAFRVNFMGVMVTYALIFPLIGRAGLVGVGWAVAGGMFATVPAAFISISQLLGLRASELMKPVGPAMLLTAVVVVSVMLVGPTSGDPSWADLAVRLAVAALTYLGVSVVLWRTIGAGPLAWRRILGGGARPAAHTRQTAVNVRSAAVLPIPEQFAQGD